jgi:HAD superfamily hydrolase (TIGR01509 family)
MLEALLWDVDGTLAESERDGHRVAFNQAFRSMGLDWYWDIAHYGRLLRTAGGRERILADMASRADVPTAPTDREALARELHRRKNESYAQLVHEGGVPLREGVRELVEEAASAGLRQGIATTTSRVNVDALLAHHFGSGWTHLFATIVCGEDVAAKKPDPEVYRLALGGMALHAQQVLALEDSPAGVASAAAAEVPVVQTRSAYFADDAPVAGAIAGGPGLHRRVGWRPALAPVSRASADDEQEPARTGGGLVSLRDLRAWHARALAAGR